MNDKQTRPTFDAWVEHQDKLVDWDDISPTEMMRMAWNAAITASIWVIPGGDICDPQFVADELRSLVSRRPQ